MATYSVSNFLATPSSTDTRMRIYDKSNKLRYTLDPNIAYFFTKTNIVIIKVEDKNDIYLDFASANEAAQALSRLNTVKKQMTQPDCPIPPGGDETVWSKANLNMAANVTTTDGDLACITAILDTPKSTSFVKVFINGIEVNVGGNYYPFDCYFSSDGGTSIRTLGDERLGDKLYWNNSIAGYDLDVIDLIDFHYLIDILP